MIPEGRLVDRQATSDWSIRANFKMSVARPSQKLTPETHLPRLVTPSYREVKKRIREQQQEPD